MKLLAALILFWTASALGADWSTYEAIGPCTSTAAPPAKPASAAPFALPKGFPYSLSTCTAPVVEWNANGAALGWGCRDGSKVYLAYYAVRTSAITSEMAQSFLSIPLAPDWKVAANAHWQQYGTTHFRAMADVWCETSGSTWRTRFNDAVRPLFVAASTATAPAWKTPASGAGTIYKVVNGSRASIVFGRTAPYNAPCDCTTQIKSLTTTYCSLAAGPPDEVTACRYVTP